MIFKSRGRFSTRSKNGMNKLEADYAVQLGHRQRLGEIIWFEFEAIKVKLAPSTFYTPDFFLMTAEGFLEAHEVKGTSKGKPFVEDDAAVKIKVAAEKFPMQFRMVWRVKGAWQMRDFD